MTLIIVVIALYAIISWVLPTFIGSLSFLNHLKPTPKAVTQVAENPALAPPVLNIPYEATSTGIIAIRGYASPSTKVEIYVDDELKTTAPVQEDGSFTSDDISLSLGSNYIYGKTIDGNDNKSLASKTITISYSNEKPKLEISSPEDNQTVTDNKITFSGTTDAGQNIIITVNGTRAIVSSDGNFSKTVNLNDGDNNISVIAINSTGNSTTISRKVTYQH